jgi:hypothetical protein
VKLQITDFSTLHQANNKYNYFHINITHRILITTGQWCLCNHV